MSNKDSALSPALLPSIKENANYINKMSIFEKWKLLVQTIIRPPKKTYCQEDLGSSNFKYGEQFYKR